MTEPKEPLLALLDRLDREYENPNRPVYFVPLVDRNWPRISRDVRDLVSQVRDSDCRCDILGQPMLTRCRRCQLLARIDGREGSA